MDVAAKDRSKKTAANPLFAMCTDPANIACDPQRWIVRCSGRLGYSVAQWPYRYMAVLVFITAMISIGFIRIKVITDGVKLWVPQSSKAMQDRLTVQSYYDLTPNFADFIVSPKDRTRGGLDPGVFAEMFDLYNAVKRELVDGQGKTYEDLCKRESWSGACTFSGYLEFWGMNRTAFDESPSSTSRDALVDKINEPTFPNGEKVEHMGLCGDPSMLPGGRVTNCKVLKMTLLLDTSLDQEYARVWFDSLDTLVQRWNRESSRIQFYVWHRRSLDDAITESVTGDVDLMAACFCLMIITSVFMLTKIKRIRRGCYVLDWRGSRILLGFIAVINVALAMVMGYGIAIGIVGIEFNTLCAVLPFILLGIGVDDAFVLVCCLEKAIRIESKRDLIKGDQPLNVKEIVAQRMRTTMEIAGPTISATSITNCIAFLLGSLTTIPALRAFCLYAGICILCDFIMQITFFLAAMTIFERRKSARDFSKVGWWLDRDVDRIQSVFDVMSSGISRTIAPLCVQSKTYKVTVLFVSLVLTVVSCFGIALLQQGLPLKDLTLDGTNLYNFFRLEDSTFGSQLGPKTHLYFVAPQQRGGPKQQCPSPTPIPAPAAGMEGEEWGGGGGANVQPQQPRTTNFASLEMQERMLLSHDYVISKGKYIQSAHDNWLLDLVRFAEEVERLTREDVTTEWHARTFVREESFAHVLTSFLLNDTYARYRNDINVRPAACPGEGGAGALEIASCRFAYYHKPTGENYGMRRKALRDVRGLERGILDEVWMDEKRDRAHANGEVGEGGGDGGNGKDSFLFTVDYLFWEQDAVLFQECLLSLGLAVAGVLCISLLTTGFSLKAMVVIVLSIMLVDLFLFGYLYVLGLRFNAVTVVNLVMAVGLSIDYSLHIAHSALERHTPTNADGAGGADGSVSGSASGREGQVQSALRNVGPAVLAGGLTTFMGILTLAFSTSFIFQMFFKLMLGTVIFGQYVSLILLPILLSFIIE